LALSENNSGGANGPRNQTLRQLPSVEEVLRSPDGMALLSDHPRWAVVAAARAEIADRRAELRRQHGAASDIAAGVEIGGPALAARVSAFLRPSLRRVVNATGVVLHTNLGRAPLAERALARVQEIARGYSNLEYNQGERTRGSRHAHVADLLVDLTGAEAAAVVNNNAAAVLLTLAAVAGGREAVVSRGEMVEIGGGFRIPDVMRQAGVTLREVGTTNKTRLADYTGAAGPQVALFLKVHRSNFSVVGFTEEVGVAALAEAGRARGIPTMIDLGSGSLVDLDLDGNPQKVPKPSGSSQVLRSIFAGEPTVRALVSDGVDLCTFSGDKLLGGPQAGLIVGRRALLDQVQGHPLMRAVRPDKMTLAALEATLELYREGTAVEDIPALRMIASAPDVLARRKDRLLAALASLAPRVAATARSGRSAVGGGALPGVEPESWMVELAAPAMSAEALAGALLAGEPPVVARIGGDRVLLDVRTLADDEIEETATAVTRAVQRVRT
jgi:L-seryl-tRNA(Ser) seleniumtransferase